MNQDTENTSREEIAEENEITEDEIDESAEESFPASDPPSWTLGTDHRKSETTDETRENDD